MHTACRYRVETLRGVQETCLFHRTHQTWFHRIHERHGRRKMCLAPELMTQKKKTEITACSLVTSRPEEKNTGLLGVLMYVAPTQLRRIHELPHNQREICHAAGQMIQETNQKLTACSLVTTKPEENGTGSLGAQGPIAAGNTVST